jgi:hypothetical protein
MKHLSSWKWWVEGARPSRCQVLHYHLDESFVTSQHPRVVSLLWSYSWIFKRDSTKDFNATSEARTSSQSCIRQNNHHRDFFSITLESPVASQIYWYFSGLSAAVSLQDRDDVRAFGCSVELLQCSYICKSHGWRHFTALARGQSEGIQ